MRSRRSRRSRVNCVDITREEVDFDIDRVPGAKAPSVVTSSVCGIRLTPKRAPRDVVDGEADAVERDRALARDVARQRRRHLERRRAASARRSTRATTAATPSTWPVTSGRRADRRPQRLFEVHALPRPASARASSRERFAGHVGSEARGVSRVTVRQTPLTAMLSPIATPSRSSVPQRSAAHVAAARRQGARLRRWLERFP